MVKQYRELKSQHPGTLLFFRLGDFYELFFEDAVIGARELQITLTARHKERGDPIPMCGVPHHSAANYIAKLVRNGYRVAVCEQTSSRASQFIWRPSARAAKTSGRLFSTYLRESFARRKPAVPKPGNASPPTLSRTRHANFSSLLRWRRWCAPALQPRRARNLFRWIQEQAMLRNLRD